MHLATREASIDVLKFLFQMGANKNAMVSWEGGSEGGRERKNRGKHDMCNLSVQYLI